MIKREALLERLYRDFRSMWPGHFKRNTNRAGKAGEIVNFMIRQLIADIRAVKEEL